MDSVIRAHRHTVVPAKQGSRMILALKQRKRTAIPAARMTIFSHAQIRIKRNTPCFQGAAVSGETACSRRNRTLICDIADARVSMLQEGIGSVKSPLFFIWHYGGELSGRCKAVEQEKRYIRQILSELN